MYLVQMRSFSFDVQIPAISCWEEILRSQRRDVFFFFGTILELENVATKTEQVPTMLTFMEAEYSPFGFDVCDILFLLLVFLGFTHA